LFESFLESGILEVFYHDLLEAAAITVTVSDPTTYEIWLKAMQEEIESLKVQKTWVLKKLPPGRRALKGKWVYKTKLNPDGTVNKGVPAKIRY
jgi:hypothetical protein